MSRTMTISSWFGLERHLEVVRRGPRGGRRRPPRTCARRASGVSSRPSRSGSSPMATRISRTAALDAGEVDRCRAVRHRRRREVRVEQVARRRVDGHALGPRGAADRRRVPVGTADAPTGRRVRRQTLLAVGADVGQVAVALGDVEAVADDEVVGDAEPDVAQVGLGLLLALLQRAGRTPRGWPGRGPARFCSR